MSRKQINRRMQRDIAFQVLFQLETNSDVALHIALNLALQSHFEQDESITQKEFESEKAFFEQYPELRYTQAIVCGVQKHREEIDALIKQYASSWKLNRVIRMDLILLRIAVYEMKFNQNDQVPDVVALNEALELAKIYSDEKSTAFINGILSNLVEKNK